MGCKVMLGRNSIIIVKSSSNINDRNHFLVEEKAELFQLVLTVSSQIHFIHCLIIIAGHTAALVEQYLGREA